MGQNYEVHAYGTFSPQMFMEMMYYDILMYSGSSCKVSSYGSRVLGQKGISGRVALDDDDDLGFLDSISLDSSGLNVKMELGLLSSKLQRVFDLVMD
uniref:Uncharacterized protein n=1 Tax=Tanacetum cinerariifolium TaxID=118510 RepID=A0A699L0N3_TANCI|nr:hypothetical protein [Tanacetum cinerariifolium]